MGARERGAKIALASLVNADATIQNKKAASFMVEVYEWLTERETNKAISDDASL